ncbi:hypothetical protein M422DRAFT_263481 [Sphaerobolus stellatus SS14]|uniref:Uncharacterized protein n=1 Tax=Sphaerobolus stellatus (strain SS14) TaxID=990650 RepID=A0A0C9VB43_SPHS4|nr:hypothetical protein M422DRAFT_263481 [Sphaerobolus stellatus SS14]
MRDTVIPMDNPDPEKRGKIQKMIFPEDLPHTHPYYDFRGKPKGMKAVLEEHGLLHGLQKANGGKHQGECKFCKSSRETQERLVREAQAMAAGGEELEGALEDVLQVPTSNTCCM